VYVSDPESDPCSVLSEGEPISLETRERAIREVRKAFHSVAIGRPIDIDAIDDSVHAILNDILSKRSPVLAMSEIRSSDPYTFSHSVNVCVISLMLGLHCRLNMKDLHQLGVGALLH